MNKWTPTTDLMTLRRLGKSVEECGELITVFGRSICQGLEGINPATGESNVLWMSKESADVLAQIRCNIRAFGLDEQFIEDRADQKCILMDEWEALFEPAAVPPVQS